MSPPSAKEIEMLDFVTAVVTAPVEFVSRTFIAYVDFVVEHAVAVGAVAAVGIALSYAASRRQEA